jgi:hypothetical protein
MRTYVDERRNSRAVVWICPTTFAMTAFVLAR